MDLKLRPLRYFLALVRERSFTRAAEKLAITQPTLSQRIRELEGELEFPLFVRSTRSVELTDAGKQLLPYAETMVAAADRMLSAAAALRQTRLHTLTIGVPLYSLPEQIEEKVIDRYLKAFPQTQLRIVRKSVAELFQLLTQAQLDIAFVLGPVPPGFITRTVAREVFDLMIPEESPLACYKEIDLEQLRGERVINHDRLATPLIYQQLAVPLEQIGAELLTPPELSPHAIARSGVQLRAITPFLRGADDPAFADARMVRKPILGDPLYLDLSLVRVQNIVAPAAESFWCWQGGTEVPA